MSAIRVVIVAVFVVAGAALGTTGAVGCGGDGKESQTQAQPKKGSAEPVSSKGKKWGGWRWKGSRENCFFMVEKRCFDDYDKACKAAKCGKAGCEKDGRAPANVSCVGQPKKKGGAEAEDAEAQDAEAEDEEELEDKE